MADFTSVRQRLAADSAITPMWMDVQNALLTLQKISEHLARYQTDPAFQAAMDLVFTQVQLQELGQVANKIDTLRADLQTNHTNLFTIAGATL